MRSQVVAFVLVFLRDRSDRLIASQFGMSSEMRGDLRAEVQRHGDVLTLDVVDRFRDDLFDALAADEESIGIAKQLGFRNQFLDSVFVEAQIFALTARISGSMA